MATRHSIRKVGSWFLRCLIATAALACASHGATAPGISAAQLCARQDSLVATESAVPTLNEIFDTMARLLPGGFAGLATDALYLQQPALADTVRATAAVLGKCPNTQAPNLWALASTAPTHGVAYTWLELRDWYQQLLAIGPAGFSTAGIVVSQNGVQIGFQTQADLDAFRPRARTLNIPDAAILLVVAPVVLGARIP